MKLTGVDGIRRGKHRTVTTEHDARAPQRPDHARRRWGLPSRRDQWWVADLTYVWTTQSFCYVSFITGSIGSVGDAYDNGLIESTIGLFKTEVIEHERPTWTGWRQVELATASWVHWYNHERLHSSIGTMPPGEFEELNYALTEGADEPVAA